MLNRFLILTTLLVCRSLIIAQPTASIDLGRIDGYDTVLKRLSYYTDFSGKLTEKDLPNITFQEAGELFPFALREPESQQFIKLSVTNSSTRNTFWLYLGKAQHYSVYEYNSSTASLHQLNQQFQVYSHAVFNAIPYTRITVEQGMSKVFYIRTHLNFYNRNLFDPVIVIPGEQTQFSFEHFLKPNRFYIPVTLVLLGIMLSMLIYYLTIFLRSFIKEYLYYTLAMLSFIVYFLLRLLDIFMFTSNYFFFSDSKIQVLQLSGSIFVLLFISAFLQLKSILPGLYRYFRLLIFIELLFLIINLPITYTNRYHYTGITGFNIMRGFLFLYCYYLIYCLLKKLKTPETHQIVIGSAISLLLFFPALYLDQWSTFKSSVINHRELALLIFMIGITLQMMFYMQAVAIRSRTRKVLGLQAVEKLQLENERKELEKYKAVIDAREKERNRISEEIHDDIGSGLTSIRLLSEIAKAKIAGETNRELDKISETSNTLIDKMNAIIWSLNSRNDSLPNLIAYLRHLIVAYFDPIPIKLSITTPDQVPDVNVDGKTRRNIVLCVKEIIHNIIKHAEATEVQIQFETDPFFSISIQDNGIGFNPMQIESHKNGLLNLHSRIGMHGGTCNISNNNGTLISLKLPALH